MYPSLGGDALSSSTILDSDLNEDDDRVKIIFALNYSIILLLSYYVN